jgi:hypothetical protein
MSTALAFAALVALIAFAFFLMWGMPRIFRGHHKDDASSSGFYAGSDGFSHSHHGDTHGGHGDGGGHGSDGGGGDGGGGSSH